jgi:molybdenum-dependent DNA-binding transcriptional regulator ModE
MDIRYIESLICVADLGSISQAATAQGLTPAAIGQRIASLEKHFGVLLLDRTSHRAMDGILVRLQSRNDRRQRRRPIRAGWRW